MKMIVVYTHISYTNEDYKTRVFLQPKEGMVERQCCHNMTGWFGPKDQ